MVPVRIGNSVGNHFSLKESGKILIKICLSLEGLGKKLWKVWKYFCNNAIRRTDSTAVCHVIRIQAKIRYMLHAPEPVQT